MAKKPKRTSHWRLHLFALGVVVFIIAFFVYFFWALTFDMKGVETIRQRSAVYDMDGAYYSRLQGEDRVTTTYDQISPHFRHALTAREDSRFYKHAGIDPRGIARAVVRNITSGSFKEGASTITQQLARNSFPLGGKNLHRKVLEAFVAMRIERTFTKEEILAYYANRIYFGSGYYGVETASQAYFGKPAAKLMLGEAALLAGLIRSPNRFSPFNNLKASLAQRDTVLDRMVELEMVTQTEADAAKKARIGTAKQPKRAAQNNYAMASVRRDLDVILREDQADEGGLKIYTTIDPKLQITVERLVEQELRKIERRPGYTHPTRADFSDAPDGAQTPYLQAAVVVIDNKTGGIRAIVGGRDYGQSQYNRALVAQRTVGSTFKPFVYAAAYERGLLPGASVDDGPVLRDELKTVRSGWSPANSDGKFKGILTAAEGLVLSRNTMSVRVGDIAGIENVQRVAEAAGLPEPPDDAMSFIGSFDATLRDLTAAYSVFANNGERRQTYLIDRIDDEDAQPIYLAAHVAAPAIEPGASWLVTRALREVLDRGTGASARKLGFKAPAAGKTGTTDDYRDAWFVGYTTGLTCGVWVGLDKPETIVSGGYGAVLALPIWAGVMQAASDKRYPAAEFEPPIELQRVELCRYSNSLATSGCARARTAYTDTLPVTRIPTRVCPDHAGSLLAPGESSPSREPARDPLPQRAFRTLRKFFGG